MSQIIDDFDRELARCDQEIAAMLQQQPTRPAYLTTLGILDWQREKTLILREKEQTVLR